MHFCLQIAEILNIFQNFDQQTLYALALTCSTFRDIALDILWGSHNDMLLLLKTFPADAWKEDGDPISFVRSYLNLT